MKRLLAVLVLCALPSGQAAAQTPGVAFTEAPSTFPAGINATRGWEFSVVDAIYVTALGLYDHGGDGLAEAREVGLWDAGSSLLASMIIPAGMGGVLGADNFRYFDLGAPLLLNPGVFRIGAFYADNAADLIAWQAGPVGAAGFVAYDGPRLGRGAFMDPTEVSNADGGAFGPNFLFDPAAAVPEPISLLLLGTGLAGVAAVRRRRFRTGDPMGA